MRYVENMNSQTAGDYEAWSDLVRVRVPAKVNVALCVGRRGDDGYHPLHTVFQALSLYDQVEVTPADEGAIDVDITGEDAEEIPRDGTDLATRAARLVRERYGRPDQGAHIRVTKSIPVAAGLAGGSADAAATLLACSVLWDLDTDPGALQALAGELGADVPFALLGGTALGTGRGTELLPLLTRGRYHWVLAFARRGLSTPSVYQRFDDTAGEGRDGLPPGLLEALASGDVPGVGARLCNDLQGPALELYGELAQTLRYGQGLDGVVGAVVSGSGPTCAFLLDEARAAKAVADEVARLPEVRGTLVAVGPVPGAQLLG